MGPALPGAIFVKRRALFVQGGDPNKAAVRERGTDALHPRGSFDIFTDSVRQQSAPWLKWEVPRPPPPPLPRPRAVTRPL